MEDNSQRNLNQINDVQRLIVDNIPSFNSLKFKKERKEKKPKETVRNFLALNRKRKRREEPSQAMQWVNTLIKKNYDTPDKIRGYFSTNNIKISEKDEAFYTLLVKSKIETGNMRISDVLTNRPLYSYTILDQVFTTTYSNDILLLEALFTKSVLNIKGRRLTKECIQRQEVALENVTICSQPFQCKGTVKKGYYQDYSETFSAIGLETLSRDNLEKILNMALPSAKTYEYNFGGYKYTAYGTDDCCIIFRTNAKPNIKLMYDAMKIVSVVNSKVAIDDRIVDIKDKPRYIDCKVRPEGFCPAFLITPEKVESSMLFKIKYDYNRLFSVIDEICSSQNTVFFPSDTLYWNTVTQFFDFVGLFSITAKKTDKNIKELLGGQYKKYCELKPIIVVMAKNQLILEKIIYEFYEAFSVKINVDKIDKLELKLRDYIDDRKKLESDESYNEIVDLFNNFKGCAEMICNQLTSPKLKALVDEMYFITNSFNNGVYINLESSLRKIGMAIFNVCYNDDKNTIKCFPINLSTGAFLGNLKGNLNFSDYLQEFISKKQERDNMKAIKEENIVNNQVDLLNNLKNYQRDVIIKSIQEYAKIKKISPPRDEINILVGEIESELENNKNVKSELNKLIVENISKNGDIGDVIFRAELIDQAVNNYKLKLEKDRIAKEQQINNINSQINDLNVIKNNLSGATISGGEGYSVSGGSISAGFNPGFAPPATYSQMSTGTRSWTSQKALEAEKMFSNKVDKTSSLSKWYTDVLLNSKYYSQLKKSDKYNIAKYGYFQLLSLYPIPNDTMLVVLEDYKMPYNEGLDKGYDWGNYKSTGQNYKDKNYINKRLKELGMT